MALVGDVIQSFRELAPDPSQTLLPPTQVTATPNFNPSSGSPAFSFAANTTAYVRATQGTPWGETAASTEVSATATQPFNLDVTVYHSFMATYVRVYWSVSPGAEELYTEIPITEPAPPVTVTIQSGVSTQAGTMPTISRAFLPDSDGNVCSASLIYRWLNDGLKLAGQLTNGIRDVTGIPSTVGVANYQVVGQWTKWDNNFYDGYPFPGGGKAEVFRHSNVTGLSGVGTCNMSADRQMVELWPQSNRTSGLTTMTYGCSATDTGIIVNGNAGWLLGFGLALIGEYPPENTTGQRSCELVYYSGMNSQAMTNIQRGMGGTIAQAWPIGTGVLECNIYLTGMRFPTLYQRGQSAFTFSNPPAWEETVRTYLNYRFKLWEQDMQGAQAEYERFRMGCEATKNSKQPLGPRRIQVAMYGGSSGVETVVGAGSIFGGVILP